MQPKENRALVLSYGRGIGCILLFIFGVLLPASLSFSQMVRIKDLAQIKGNRSNQLIGFGLVVGLPATGDSQSAIATNQATASLIKKFGMKVGSDPIPVQSVAGVVVTAELPAFAKNGDRIDVKVSVLGDAKSLAGGTLLPTHLKAGDGNVYVVGSGAVVMQDLDTGPKTVATVTQGGTVEREFIPEFTSDNLIRFHLREPDFSTNSAISEAINNHLRGFYARSVDPSLVEVEIPEFFEGRVVEFLAELENIKVKVNRKAIVVFNQRTGTIVMGDDVAIGKVVVSHGNISIEVNPDSKDKAKKTGSVTQVGGATVGQLISSLNALGLKPQEMITIFQAIYAAGGLSAELKIL
ncbi:MAG: flagellar basal body P-ring protein FlgI [Oligoflexales bacterium]